MSDHYFFVSVHQGIILTTDISYFPCRNLAKNDLTDFPDISRNAALEEL